MSWWTSANVEPKRKSRFIVEIANGFFLPNVKTCSKPSANVDIKEFQLINHKFKYPGVVTWGDIKITMIDMNGNSGTDQSLDTALLLWRMLKHTGYNIPTEAVGPIAALGPNRQLTTTEKASSIANGFGRGLYGKADFGPAGVGQSSNAQSVRIYTLDPEGNTVETWTLHNPQIKTVNWGDHAYDSDEFVEYSLDISYDFAHLEKGRKVTVGPGLFDTPEINTPVSIQTKYNDLIATLQDGKAFTEAKVNKELEKSDVFGNLPGTATGFRSSPDNFGLSIDNQYQQRSSPSYLQGIAENNFKSTIKNNLKNDPDLLPEGHAYDYESEAAFGPGSYFGGDVDPYAKE